MAEIRYKTDGNASPKGKPRVYFSCHPEDFSKQFSRVCEDLFRAQDCAVYYTPDMSEPMTEENRTLDLERMQLFVIPVTYTLLTTENRTIDHDLPFAISHGIPILPLMLESGLDKLYGREDRFGKRQYLEPDASDDTQIPYSDKLKLYLKGVLLDDRLLSRVRSAFAAYIFLSYRKMDRRHANDLMRLIHQLEDYQGVAIWFDEFLVAGEAFDEAITEKLAKSKFFTLLVTPNLREKPNYVMTTEYPDACTKYRIPIFPVEMEETDLDDLSKVYPETEKITDCAKPMDTADFHKRLLQLLVDAHITPAAHDPETEYLIGLAYMEGVDMETDRQRGLSMLRSAADRSYPEAMHELFTRYKAGTGVPLDWNEAAYWAQRIYDTAMADHGPDHEDTFAATNELAGILMQLGKYDRALPKFQEAYDAACRLCPDDRAQCFAALSNLATCHRMAGHLATALEQLEQIREYYDSIEETPSAEILSNLSTTYEAMAQYEKAMDISQMAYAQALGRYGEKDARTLTMQENLAMIFIHTGQPDEAIRRLQKTLEQRRDSLGEDHPDTLTSISDLGRAYSANGQYQQALEKAQQAYDRRLEILKEKHPDTLISMNNLAAAHQKLCHFRQALELSEKEFALCCSVLGEKHPDALISRHNLAAIHSELAHYQQAKKLLEEAHTLQCEVLGEDHPATISVLLSQANVAQALGEYEAASTILTRAQKLTAARLGEDSPTTLLYAQRIADVITSQGDDYAAAEQMLQELENRLRIQLGDNHPEVYAVVNSRASNLLYWGRIPQALELQQQVVSQCLRHYGPSAPTTLILQGNLARMYCHQGNHIKKQNPKDKAAGKAFETAIDLHRKVYNRGCARYGEKHPEAIDMLNALAVAIGEAGDYDKSIPLMNQVYELRCEMLGKDHLDTLESLSNLAAMQGHRAKHDKLGKVVKKDREVYEGHCRVLGETHPTTIRYLEDLATSLSRAGYPEDALELDEKAYTLRLSVQKAHHRQTQKALELLIYSHKELKHFDRVCELIPEAIKWSTVLNGADAKTTLALRLDQALFHHLNGEKEVCNTLLEALYLDCREYLGPFHQTTMEVYQYLLRFGCNPKL